MKAGREWRSGKILKKETNYLPRQKKTHTHTHTHTHESNTKKKLKNHTQQTSNLYKKKLHIKNNSQKLHKKKKKQLPTTTTKKSSQIAYHNFLSQFFHIWKSLPPKSGRLHVGTS